MATHLAMQAVAFYFEDNGRWASIVNEAHKEAYDRMQVSFVCFYKVGCSYTVISVGQTVTVEE